MSVTDLLIKKYKILLVWDESINTIEFYRTYALTELLNFGSRQLLPSENVAIKPATTFLKRSR